MSYTILLIEDNLEMADNISSLLELAHYKVQHAENGKKGVELAQQNSPDLILCDVMMPELDGYGVLHILNNDPNTSKIPFIFLTAKADKSDFRAGMNLGADDYITKPFDAMDLLKVIETRLKKSEFLKRSFDAESRDVSAFFNAARESKEFQTLSENRPVRKFRKKDLIFMEGQSPNDLYFIKKGQVKTYKLNFDGKELITGIYKAGDLFGYVSLLDEKPYNENAEVLEESQIAIIPKPDFLNVLYSSKDMARKFLKMLSNNVGEMENRLLDVAYQPVRERVARALLNISETIPPSTKDPRITVARKDISNIVATAIESLNRTLSDFKDEGLIEICEDGLKIINKTKLQRLAHEGPYG